MRSRILAVIIILINSVSYSLSQQWVAVDPALIATGAKRDIVPERYITYETEPQSFQQLLEAAPDEMTTALQESNTIIKVGLANGTTDDFRIVSYSMMEDGLSRKYPQMKTYRGISVTNEYKTIRIDWTQNGFRAVIREPGSMTYIDPFQRGDIRHRIVYYKKDMQPTGTWSCDVAGVSKEEDLPGKRVAGDCMFRTYRLAQAANGEYCNFFGATSSAQSAIIMSEVITATNRVNEVYEIDVSVRMILVDNTDTLFFYNPSTDPYTNSNGQTMLGQNITTCNNRIGTANYDIGHVYSTGGGGVAYLKSVCINTIKAGGVTGQPNPVNDPFYIDYVAHEMGHQFGGNHTQNNPCNSNSSTAMEPGSASTIMGYAGICAPNVQSNSDAYFHGVNIQEIANHIAATSCDIVISTANSAPVVANLLDYTIPISTPFVLTASATDPNNNPMTYCWEQWDQEAGTMPPAATNTVGPMFRSLDPSTSPSRYFYNLTDLTNNVNPTWEELPSVTRAMEFKVVVRDNNGQYGCTDEDNTIINTTSTAGPFVVTSQNSGATWVETSIQTITWNVANTTASPVNCATVDIFMSHDGGFTYPFTLATNEPNDGSVNITVPVGTTNDGRIMVKASANVFFDINNQDIIVEAGVPNFTISLNPTSVTECNDGSVSTTVNVGSFLGFINPVTLSMVNTPPGSVASFFPSVVIPGGSSTLTISNLGGLSGTYTPIVRGTSTTGNKDEVFTINLTLTGPTQHPSLVSPEDNAIDVLMTPLLEWNTVAGFTVYEFQVASDEDFDNIVVSGMVNDDQYLITSGLNPVNEYYWRVRAINICGGGTWSPVFSFTCSCFQLLSTDIPKTISANGTPTITSVFTTDIEMEITDVNIVSLIGTHSRVRDLQFFLKAPSTTEVLFWNRPCHGNNANFNINFDDEAASGSHPCPPTNGLTYRPGNSLAVFDGQMSNGTWMMTIQDLNNGEGGSLNSWGLRVCGVSACDLMVLESNGSGDGTLVAAVACASPGDTIVISSSLAGQTLNVGNNPIAIDKNIHIVSQSLDVLVTGSGQRVFEVAPGVQVKLEGMVVRAGNSLDGGAIRSEGSLTLKNVNIEKNPLVSGATLLSNIDGILTMEGSCQINQ